MKPALLIFARALSAAGQQAEGGFPFFQTEAPRLVARLEVTIVDKDLEGVQVPAGPGASVTGMLRLDGGDIRSLTCRLFPGRLPESRKRP